MARYFSLFFKASRPVLLSHPAYWVPVFFPLWQSGRDVRRRGYELVELHLYSLRISSCGTDRESFYTYIYILRRRTRARSVVGCGTVGTSVLLVKGCSTVHFQTWRQSNCVSRNMQYDTMNRRRKDIKSYTIYVIKSDVAKNEHTLSRQRNVSQFQ